MAEDRVLSGIVCTVKGKLVVSDKHEGLVYSTVLLPAADEFERPQALKLRSRKVLGQINEIIEAVAHVGGYLRPSFKTKPDNNGEIRTVRPVEITLDVE